MSESTSTPRQDDEGTFVGGSFGTADEGTGDALDVEATEATGDVEGTGDEVPPGERNDPV